jgi:hypothetical protein
MIRKIATTFAAVIAVVGLSVGLWFGGWALYRANQSAKYEANTHSQQYQAAMVSSERDRVSAYDAATSDAQKTNIATTFCQVYTELDPPTPDLETAHARICN